MSTTAMSGTVTPAGYPVRVDAHLDEPLSRGLWLVKWLLAIPHYVVLAFLWIAFVVTSVMAFFAILVTGRYPRALFDFNVGVLRWSWRVSFYAYGALGTDRYPPFSLHDVVDYPAHLEVEPPARLSRGLVLVKWWLLVIPHYLVLALFLGGVGYAVQEDDREAYSGIGLIGLFVLVAAVVLLFTGRYPGRLFDLVVGLNRWVLRVAAYAALMTDRYPPFALDQGGPEAREPGPLASTVPEPPPPLPVRHDAGWSPGRVVSLVAGSVLLVVGLGLAGAAVTVAVVDRGARDRDGFLMSETEAFDSPTYAITSQSLRLHTDAPGDFLPSRLLGDARLVASAAGDADLFLGIGPAPEVADYLSGVAHETITGIEDGDPELAAYAGSQSPGAPTRERFWVAEDSGPGDLAITWELAEGDWTVVLMNADGSAVVSAEVAVGAEIPGLDDAARVLGVLSALAVLAGVVLVVVPLRGISAERRSRSTTTRRNS